MSENKGDMELPMGESCGRLNIFIYLIGRIGKECSYRCRPNSRPIACRVNTAVAGIHAQPQTKD